ncbi:TRAPP subunit BET5 ASCRUDRAFT_30305 [Ascoidea rubescens DSM 1968]|uniref:Trafficking protein particle complex subunit n=1 Tax=Ascoidea rubescens DSM 1968 TaxID=1344418 RepID=A0A1D2VPT3_9ASCO|nr:hypothetical protein ASCRUDRAFT_30305 [Ascoidea rubescens DSM 1968]ODV63594.1 hypothetical protein ASCRUDRAFT_30305 [Ascoidea rubescens DSM 1968]
MIYSLWIFDRHCIIQQDPKAARPLVGGGTVNLNNDIDSAKLLFGALFSLRNIASKLTSNVNIIDNTSSDLDFQKQNYLRSFATQNYRAHYFETLSGLKFVLLTDPSIQDMQKHLHEIYTNFYVEYVAKNALSPVDFKPGELIGSEKFINSVDSYILSLSVT